MRSAIVCISFLFLSTMLSAQWVEVTAPPDNFRSDHTFGFAIGDAGYLVTGNVDFEETADFYRYSAETDSWTQLPDFPGGTRGYSIGDVLGDKAYFGFGRGDSPTSGDGEKNDLWVFDGATEEWTELATCPCSARIHPAMVAHDGFVYVGLGSGSNGNLNDWWAYDIETDSWTQKTDFPSFERHHPYQFAIGDYVYVGFGHGNVGAQIYREWYQYDPVNDSWTQVSDIPGQGRVAGTQFSHGGFGYILSGDGDDHSAMPNGEFWKYDGDEDTWEELESHPGQSRWAPASFVLNNEVYLFNGSTSFTNYPDESYKFSLEVPSGLEDVELNENAVQVYPNPFDDQLRLNIGQEVIDDFSNATIQVRNLLGQIMIETNLISGSEEINLEELAVGVYHLNVFDGETKIAAKKIVRIK